MTTPTKAQSELHALAVSVAEAVAVLARELGRSTASQSFPRAVEDEGPEAPLGRVIPFPTTPGKKG